MSYKNICECGQKWSLLEHVRCPRCSPESACSAAWMRRLADQVERLDRYRKLFENDILVLADRLDVVAEKLNAVSPVQPTQSASEDWLVALREFIGEWGVSYEVDKMPEREQGWHEGVDSVLIDLRQWLAKRSASNKTSEGSDGSLVG